MILNELHKLAINAAKETGSFLLENKFSKKEISPLWPDKRLKKNRANVMAYDPILDDQLARKLNIETNFKNITTCRRDEEQSF